MPLVAAPVEAPALPTNPAELARCLADPMWRITSGCLYKILVKGDDDDEGTVLPFRPNAAQLRFISRLHNRNLILKARQLGFSTLVCILWLDHALFVPNQRCGIIAESREKAEELLRDKVKFAYLNLPEALRGAIPTATSRAAEIVFSNNSSIRVATSLRGGTYHREHVSEYGEICANFPDKAREIKSGSLPAVPATGIAIIEATAKGQAGDFHKMSTEAQALFQQGRKLGVKDWRFHFYAWWQEPKYRVDPSTVLITKEDDDYFERLEGEHGILLDAEQRAWYVATLAGDFHRDEQMMWQQFPSYPEEAFKVSIEGTYYAKQLAQARKEGRIGFVPYMPGVPVNTFWDIGLNDLNAIWFHQRIGMANNFINYLEASGEAPAYYVKEMQDLGYVYGWHYLPHDGNQRRMQEDSTHTYAELLTNLKLKNIEIVPRILAVTTGIQMVRNIFPTCRFDEKKCAKGVAHLGSYRKQWNTRLGTWSDQPLHDEASNAADALRQFAQGYTPKGGVKRARGPINWKTT